MVGVPKQEWCSKIGMACVLFQKESDMFSVPIWDWPVFPTENGYCLQMGITFLYRRIILR